jgi:hypothetical protein
MAGVIEDPPPRADVHALGDFNVILRVFGWVDQRHCDFLKGRSEAIRLVKEAFDAAGIVMAEPIYNVRAHELAAPRTRHTDGPGKPVDIGRRSDVERQIAEDRRESGESDLLRSDAPLE